MHSTRLICLLLEGADWALLEPMLERGLLPVLAGLRSRGIAGHTVGHAPFHPASLFTSAVSGCRAWRHGVVGSPPPAWRSCARGSAAPLRRQVPALWEHLASAGRPSLVVSDDIVEDAEPASGCFVGASFIHKGKVSGVLPTALAGELEPMRVTAHTLDPGVMRLICPSLTHEVASGDPLAGRLAGNLADAYTLHNIASSLLETEDWELAVIRSSFLEKMLRDFACFASPAAGAPHAQVERYGNVIEGACRLQDLLLGELLRACGPGARLMLASTRGVPAIQTDATLAYPLKPAGMGIFVAAGPGIRGGTRLGTLDILDIAPTALRALGLGAHAAILDGRAVGDIFDSNPAPDSIAVPAPVPLPAFLDEVALRGSDWECHSLGLDLLESARPQAALPLLQRAAWLRPECPWRAFWLATCLSRLGLESQAREAAATLVDNDDGTPGDARLLLALIHASLGCTAEVLRLLPASIAKDSRAGGLVSTLAHALMDRERWDEAFDLLRERLCVRESNDIWLALTRCYLHHHLFHDAEEASRHVLAQNPRLAHAHLCLARALDAQGRREEAWHALMAAQQLAPAWPEVREAIRHFDPDRAAAILQPTPAVAPNPAQAVLDCSRLRTAWTADLATSGAVPLPVLPVGNEAVETRLLRGLGVVYRPPVACELPRLSAMLNAPAQLRAGWRPRVWVASGPPERFVACASWTLTDAGPAHLLMRFVPGCLALETTREMARCVVDEIFSTTASQIVATTPERACWPEVFTSLSPSSQYWTDEDWVGDPLRMRERLLRFDELASQARRQGWSVRPLAEPDWKLVSEWGLERRFFTDASLARMRSRHDPVLSAAVIADGTPAGVLVAVRQVRNVVLEFISGNPAQPARWPLATLILLRHLLGDIGVPGFDTLLLTTNLNNGKAMHRLARKLGMVRTREHHHFLLPPSKSGC